jgi:sugar/nucleoside kinase (ribokinase family)
LIIRMTERKLKFGPDKLLYDCVFGTGGIGSGKFFVLNGDHTLGREESRSGHFLEISDYCKQHIILHYVKVLLGPSFSVIPIGKVGNDDTGQSLLNEMNETGFDMKLITKEGRASTLFSFCFYYPDGSGGNLTTDNSACSLVDAAYIDEAEPEIKNPGKRGIIMAAPEVPFEARRRLIELGKKHGQFCTASFTTGEIGELMSGDLATKIDLIAINSDEAAAVADMKIPEEDLLPVVQRAIRNLVSINKNIMLSVTDGKNGSWCWDGAVLHRFPAVRANVVSTAGAGDAFFSGLISGLALGLSLSDAQQLASLVAGLSVSSPDTIHKGIDRQSLNQFLHCSELKFSDTILKLLEE